MGSLRDLIEQNKRKAMEQNGSVTKSVLQSSALKETQAAAQSIGSETLSKETIGTEEHIRAEIDTNQSGTVFSTTVVESGPLKKVSLLARLNKGNGQAQPQTQKIEQPKPQEPIQEQKPQIENNKGPETNSGTLNLDELRSNLTYLANNIEQKDLVGQIVRKIAFMLKQNPALVPHLRDADVDLCVRALRRAYTVKARQATEKRESKKKNDTVTDELAQAFKDAGLFK